MKPTSTSSCPAGLRPRAGNGKDLTACPFRAVCEHGTGEQGNVSVALCSVQRNHMLFEAGDEFHGVYLLHGGAFKNLAVLDGQENQVVDFRLPGDVLGMAAMGSGRYPFTAQALEPSSLCRVSIEMGEQQCLHPDLIVTMSRQLQRIQWASVMLRTQNAEQRVIHFLLDVARSMQPDARLKGEMKLPMSRKDIANYLGVAVETVSRALHRLQDEGLLSTSGRKMQFHDRRRLAQRLAGTEPVVYP
jgi:CRP/FNR family transcriptional regulator